MAMKARYTVIESEVIAEKRNSARHLYEPDSLGSTVALVDDTQTQINTFSYWPYGEVNQSTGSNPPPFQYVGTKGYYTDDSGKLYELARYLDAPKGRWLTQDPFGFVGGYWNLYQYVGSRPTYFIDPWGLAQTTPVPVTPPLLRPLPGVPSPVLPPIQIPPLWPTKYPGIGDRIKQCLSQGIGGGTSGGGLPSFGGNPPKKPRRSKFPRTFPVGNLGQVPIIIGWPGGGIGPIIHGIGIVGGGIQFGI